jgi:hypothetical protein
MYQYVAVDELRALLGAATAAKRLAATTAIAALRGIAVLLLAPPLRVVQRVITDDLLPTMDLWPWLQSVISEPIKSAVI